MQNVSTRSSISASALRPPMLEQLERRQLMDAVILEPNIGLRNTSAGGFSTNQSVLTIPLTEKVNIADANLIQVRGYAINPIAGGQKKLVINVVNVQVVPSPEGEDFGYIQLTTDRLMRKGGRIYFYAGSLTHQADGSAVDEQIVRSPKGQNKERFTLASRAFRPTDINLFNQSIYPSASAPSTQNGAVPDGTARADLTALLAAKIADGTITGLQRDRALAGYDSSSNRSTIPDHNMRAALFSLTGTLAESAISTYLTADNASGSPYTILEFQDTTDPGVIIAETRVLDNGRLRLRIKTDFRGENFAAISTILAHEAVHQDSTFSIQEEVIANIFQDVVYAQQLDADPNIATEGSGLVKILNTQQLALLNSGRGIFPLVGTLAAPIRNSEQGVFPFAADVAGGDYVSYTDYLTRLYQARGGSSGTTPGNTALEAYYDNFVSEGSAGNFSDTIITELDSTLFNVLLPPMSVRIAGALKLTV